MSAYENLSPAKLATKARLESYADLKNITIPGGTIKTKDGLRLKATGMDLANGVYLGHRLGHPSDVMSVHPDRIS